MSVSNRKKDCDNDDDIYIVYRVKLTPPNIMTIFLEPIAPDSNACNEHGMDVY